MSLTVVRPGQAVEDGPCREGCLIRTTDYRGETPAYRPHTLEPDCWCTLARDGTRARIRCRMAYWVQPWTPNR